MARTPPLATLCEPQFLTPGFKPKMHVDLGCTVGVAIGAFWSGTGLSVIQNGWNRFWHPFRVQGFWGWIQGWRERHPWLPSVNPSGFNPAVNPLGFNPAVNPLGFKLRLPDGQRF